MNWKNSGLIIATVLIIAAAAVPLTLSEDSDATVGITGVTYNSEANGIDITFDASYTMAQANVAISNTDGIVYETLTPVLINGSTVPVGLGDTEIAPGEYTVTVTIGNDSGTFTLTVSSGEPEPTPETATVTIVQPANGKIVVTGAEDLTAVEIGTVLTCTVTADEGYHVDGEPTWTVNVTGDMEITLPEGVTIVADVVEPETAAVTVADIENGTITVTGAEDLTAVEIGTVLTCTVTADEGYHVDGEPTWTVNVTGDMEITLPEGVTIVADTPVDPDEDPADRPFTNTITLSDGAVINASSSINASETQEVIIAGDVTVANGGEINVKGKLTVQSGAVLTIEEGGIVSVTDNGIVDIQGDLVVEGTATGTSFIYGGCAMTVAGTVTLEGANSFATTSTAKGIEISGTFEVGDDASAKLDGATVTEGGELLVYGVVYTEEVAIVNNGTITVDSQGLKGGNTTAMYVELKATGTVDIINVYGIVLVSDMDLTFDASKAEKDKDAVNDNAVYLENVAGVTVTEKLVIEKNEDGETVGTNTMYVAGSVAVSDDYSSSTGLEGIVAITENGDSSAIEIADTVTLGENVTMVVTGDLTVSGEVSALESAVAMDGVTLSQVYLMAGKITVTGKITTNGGILGEGVINAAYYETERTTSVPAYTVYTTLNTALTDGTTGIALSGDNELIADATIPVGTTVDMDAGATLTVGKDVTLTIASDDRKSGKLNSTEADSVIVDGTLVAQNYGKSGIRDGSIESHTYKDVENARTYTNIYNALANATDGETVKVSYGKTLTIEQDVEIRSGVTLLIPAGENVFVDNGITVTVDGTLVSQGAYIIASEIEDDEETADVNEYKAAGATVVNGMMLYNDGDYTADIVGAYFEYTYEKTVMNAIAPLASLPAIADDVKSDVYLYGKMSLGAIDFSAYDGEGVLETIVAKNDLTIESLTIGNVVFDASAAGAVVNGTIALANGTVVLDNVYGIIVRNVVDQVEDTVTSEISGKILAYDNPETENVAETGTVSVTGTVVATDGFVLGNIVGQDEKQTVSMDVPAGSTLVVKAGTFNTYVTVEGTVTVAGANVAFAQLAVTGTIAADGKYVATVKELYVGVTADDLAMAGVGSVDGITLAKDTGSVAYVSPNATVGEDIVKNLKSTEYYAEDALYLTAYANQTNSVKIDIPFTVDSAYFAGWQYEDKDGKMMGIDKVNDMVGKYEAVYADIVYDIYYVTVTADAGIGTVAIDGIVLINQGGNVFELNTPLAAGQHTVSYTLKSGYQGEAKLTIGSEGVTVSGMNFALSGNQDNQSEVAVSLSLAGTEPGQTTVVVDNGGSGDSGMGLTDYLLIILVILIVIMAIMVAFRLMRS